MLLLITQIEGVGVVGFEVLFASWTPLEDLVAADRPREPHQCRGESHLPYRRIKVT